MSDVVHLAYGGTYNDVPKRVAASSELMGLELEWIEVRANYLRRIQTDGSRTGDQFLRPQASCLTHHANRTVSTFQSFETGSTGREAIGGRGNASHSGGCTCGTPGSFWTERHPSPTHSRVTAEGLKESPRTGPIQRLTFNLDESELADPFYARTETSRVQIDELYKDLLFLLARQRSLKRYYQPRHRVRHAQRPCFWVRALGWVPDTYQKQRVCLFHVGEL
ncbi:hypothetical protein BDM02DRAFT_3126158 [Thelephora ganbajun]|uniref:Uncharacterized protein n=1 Tax=Thelephora ganbajun TaxID=370292 RepID=A0ACB6ZSZ7_THEGA|nr:hypothetical protein BDM02DRAFT_3126158 [Thelephora ganbajun]